MKFIDIARLTAYGVGQLLQVGRDALGDISGKSMPYLPEPFLKNTHLGDVLSRYAVPIDGNEADSKALRDITINGVTQLPIPSVSSNCQNVVVDIDHEMGEQLPNSLFVKLPMASIATRLFFGMTQSWALESYFCRHIAPQVPLRTPRTYATHCDGTRFFLAQENLNNDPDVTLFTNPDMLAGPPLPLVYRCLDAFAQLHACHYDLDSTEREKILPLSAHIFLGKRMGVISRCLNEAGLAPCLKRYPGLIPDPIVDAYRKTLEHWDKMLELWFSGPLSLLHGDSHLGNFFVSGDEMGMLDFQAVHWGKGARDIQYFLIDSLPADVLAANEQDFIRYYVERRAVHGTAIDFEQTWQEYRGFTYHTLMTIVVSIGFGAMNDEQAALMKEILVRSVAAVERVDYVGWLDEQLSLTPA